MMRLSSVVEEKAQKAVGSSSSGSGVSVRMYPSIPPQRWVLGIVQSVTNFGLFVRPAGMDATGLVHNSRVPRDLVSRLKQRASLVDGSATVDNVTDIQRLFSAGDVVKVRVNSVAADTQRIELSMLPHRASDDDEDDYVVEGRDPEVVEGSYQRNDDEEEEDVQHDVEETLLWWRGSPYVKTLYSSQQHIVANEEEEVIMENSAVVEGTWRRMFEVDMRQDQADFSTKAREAEEAELEEEIGELVGLDESILPGIFGSSSGAFGRSVSVAAMPNEWKDAIQFFKNAREAEDSSFSLLRQGKVQEQSEFEALLREVESEMAAAQRTSPVTPADPAMSAEARV